MRSIGVLMPFAADDPEAQNHIVVFGQGLQQFGWTIGRNVLVDIRWTTGHPDRIRKYLASRC